MPRCDRQTCCMQANDAACLVELIQHTFKILFSTPFHIIFTYRHLESKRAYINMEGYRSGRTGLVSKTKRRASGTWVRIPLPPPCIILLWEKYLKRLTLLLNLMKNPLFLELMAGISG